MTPRRVARLELLQAWRARVVPLAGALITLFLIVAVAASDARLRTERAQRDRYQAIVSGQFIDQPERHPHRVSHYGFLVFRPDAPLSVFDTGVQAYTGTSIFLEAHRQNSANFSDVSQADGLRRFGELTPALVLQLFVPLLILVLAAVSITREREAGTLPLILCQGARWSAVLGGKLAGALLVIAAVLAPGLLLIAIWLWRTGGVEWSADVAARLALLAATHVLYLVACAAIGVAVSASCRTSRAAVIAVVSLWVALWILLPRALPAAASWLYPVPSRAAFEAGVESRVRELGDSHNPNDPRFEAMRRDVLARHGVSRVDELPFNYNGLVMAEGEKLTTDAYREFLGRLLETYRGQARLIAWAGVITPYVAMRTSSMTLAGVDTLHGIEFERQAEEYRFRLIQALNELHMDEVEYGRDRYVGSGDGAVPSRQRIDREHWRELPRFDYAPTPVGHAIAQQPLNLIPIAVWAVAALALVAGIGRRAAAM